MEGASSKYKLHEDCQHVEYDQRYCSSTNSHSVSEDHGAFTDYSCLPSKEHRLLRKPDSTLPATSDDLLKNTLFECLFQTRGAIAIHSIMSGVLSLRVLLVRQYIDSDAK